MRKITVAVAISICLIASIIVGFPRYGDAEVIYGCYGKIAGVLRIVDGPNKCTRLEIPITWNSEGPQGPAGPAGSGGIVAQVCPVGQVVAGFDGSGNIICVPRGRALPPVFTSVTGPFFDLGDLICNDPILGPDADQLFGDCHQGLGVFNQLARYEVSGVAEPGKTVMFYLNGDCSGNALEFVAHLKPFCNDYVDPTRCIFLLPLIQVNLSIDFQPKPSASGDFTAILLTSGTGATISATTGLPTEEKSDCVAFTLP
jgi:hypothetical protein